MKCKYCEFENLDGTNYCQRCGKKLTRSLGHSKWKKQKYLAGNGTRGSSLAPLGGIAIENQAKSLGGILTHKHLVKVSPLENGSWYCPDCGELNAKYSRFCKGCGRDYV